MDHQQALRRDNLPTRRTTWAWAVATVFGTGFLRPGPGTYGSVVAVLLWYGVAHLAALSGAHLAIATAIAALLVTAIGIPASTRVARESARKDPGHVVVDEVAGQLLALLPLAPTLPQAALGLLLFRAFDITKPPPIRRLEALPEGTGIMLDDLLAGGYAALLALLLQEVAPHLFR